MQIKLEKSDLVKWLKGAGAVAVLSLSLANNTVEISTNMASLKTITTAIERHDNFFGDGPYLVNYEPHSADDEDDIEYYNFAVAITALTKIVRGPTTGGYEKLLASLADYQYINKVSQESFGLAGYLLIAIPQDPQSIADLEKILSDHAMAYAFPDEAGEIGNLRLGNGLSV